ncbi:MAG: hypothetical protein AAGN82_05850 [Myxococcota bacterium]
MPSVVFLYILAGLTVLAGVVLAVMLAKRRRPVETTTPRAPRIRLDAYALPAEYEEADPDGDDDDFESKICPRCGARYHFRHRFCDHDDAELAALN